MKIIKISLIALAAFTFSAIGFESAQAHSKTICKTIKNPKYYKGSNRAKYIKTCKKYYSHKHYATKPMPVKIPPKNDNHMIATCGAKDLQYLIGKDRSVLYTMRFASTVRIEEPGMMYTQEYSAERTRIIIGEDGKIKNVICG